MTVRLEDMVVMSMKGFGRSSCVRGIVLLLVLSVGVGQLL